MKTNNDLSNIKELLEIINNKIDLMKALQVAQAATISLTKDQVSVINKKLDAHTASLMSIESTLAGYADMYKVNDSNVRKVQKRVEVIEKKLDINPPEELSIPNFE